MIKNINNRPKNNKKKDAFLRKKRTFFLKREMLFKNCVCILVINRSLIIRNKKGNKLTDSVSKTLF